MYMKTQVLRRGINTCMNILTHAYTHDCIGGVCLCLKKNIRKLMQEIKSKCLEAFWPSLILVQGLFPDPTPKRCTHFQISEMHKPFLIARSKLTGLQYNQTCSLRGDQCTQVMEREPRGKKTRDFQMWKFFLVFLAPLLRFPYLSTITSYYTILNIRRLY